MVDLLSENTYDSNEIIRILAVGDVMLGISSLRSIAERNTIPSLLVNDCRSMLIGVKPCLENKDILFGNLECTISKNHYNCNDNNPQFLIAPIEAVSFLKYGDFDILNLANNHILDHGIDKVIETVNILEIEGLHIIGAPYTKFESDLCVLEIKNKKIGFLGFNLCREGKSSNISTILQSIKENREIVDILILSLHWGWEYEYSPKPSSEQIRMAHVFADAGVDIILGHHSHVFQSIERYHGKVIAYSLGNFIFDMEYENCLSGILEILIGQNNEISFKEVPIKQIDNKLQLSENGSKVALHTASADYFNSQIINETNPKYRKKHNKDILYYYLSNFYKFSIAFHIATITRWSKKFLKNSFNYIKQRSSSL